MSPVQQKPIVHGRDHMAGGPDPIPGMGTGGGHTIEDEGTPLTDRTSLNFVGAGVTATDDAGNDETDITIPGISAVFGIGQPGQRIGVTENRWYLPGVLTSAGSSTNVTTVNLRSLWPFIPGRDMTLDRIVINVTAAIAASKIRLGMYTDNGNLYPDALLFDTGDVATTSTGAKSTTISQAVEAGTLYWVAQHYSHNTIQLRGAQISTMMGILGWSDPAGGSQAIGLGWQETTAYAALPDPYPAGATPIDVAATDKSSAFLRGT